MTERKKEKVKIEKVEISATVEWGNANLGVKELQRLLEAEVTHLQSNPGIRNAYSPITWVKLCRSIKHVTEGMTAVRLSVEGMSASEINEATGIATRRIGAFKAWNTVWKKAVNRYMTLKWRKAEERSADIAFLISIGISVDEENTQ